MPPMYALLALLNGDGVAGLPYAGQGRHNHPMPTDTVGCWYKVASYTQNDWSGFSGPTNPAIPNPLHPELGMAQTLGFEIWQALCDDIRSLDVVITDMDLWYESTPNNNPTTTYFDDHPAGGSAVLGQFHRVVLLHVGSAEAAHLCPQQGVCALPAQSRLSGDAVGLRHRFVVGHHLCPVRQDLNRVKTRTYSEDG